MKLMPAMVTPFDHSGSVDTVATLKLVAHFTALGVDGLVVAGTTGEGPSLSSIEKRDLVRVAVAASDLPIILGVASNSGPEAVWIVNQAERSGAKAALVMPPAYFAEATDDGILGWYRELRRETSLDLLVYNFPARVGRAVASEMLRELAEIGYVGLKDSSGDAANLAVFRASMPRGQLYVGSEVLLPDARYHGWNGVISGAANVLAGWLTAICREEDPGVREAKFRILDPVIHELRGSDIGPLSKAILKVQGVLSSDAVRLPLTGPSAERVSASIAVMKALGV